METNYIVIAVAAIAAFVWSTVYYLLLGKLIRSPE